MASKWRGGRDPHVEPNGKVRQSQASSTFGPGAMIDLVHDAVVVGGLDFWRYDDKGRSVSEPRLRDAIASRLESSGRKLRDEGSFRLPPTGDDHEPRQNCGIEVLEFPKWFICQNPDCRALVQSDQMVRKGDKYIHSCDGKKGNPCVPVRFVMACKNGHLEEFPWISYVHGLQGRPRCAAPALRLHEGGTGDFADVAVRCACGASRPMSNALVEQVNPTCSGQRPWLGREGQETCSERLRLLVRTASNSYFPQVVSALSIPEPGLGLRDAIREQWSTLQIANESSLAVLGEVPKIQVALDSRSDAEILETIEDIRQGKQPPRDALRTAEFKQFTGSVPERIGDLPPPKGHYFFARTFQPRGGLPTGIARLVLAHRLREVRVQVGLTRLESATPDLQGEYDLGVAMAPLGLQTDWLPATEVRGEGIFIQLDEQAVQRWENRDVVMARSRELFDGFQRWSNGGKTVFPGARFYLLHSLSHLLMTALSIECGYGASALTERIYCAPATDPTPMAAILISTGSTGTEGTLGGLVEQGRHLRAHLRLAFDMGKLCSNDPVCASHKPSSLTERNLEGAACHGCLFVAECSCERFNQYLDRALVVPALGHDGVAFLTERP